MDGGIWRYVVDLEGEEKCVPVVTDKAGFGGNRGAGWFGTGRIDRTAVLNWQRKRPRGERVVRPGQPTNKGADPADGGEEAPE